MPKELLKSGDPINANWRKINEALLDVEKLVRIVSRQEAAIAALRRRPFISAPGAGGGEVKRFKITAVATSYLTTNPYTAAGTVDTGTTINVARPPLLRDADGERTRTVGSSTVVEEIWPPYAVADDIYAMESAVPTGVVDGASDPVTWLDLNPDARHWAPKFVEIPGCVSSVLKHRMAVAGTVY